MHQTLTTIKDLLATRGLAPKKSLGQNFLVDHNLVKKLADAADLKPGDVALEVGPGTGVLTEELLIRGVRVIACELDDGLAALLEERLVEAKRAGSFRLIKGDCLDGKRALHPTLREILLPLSSFKLVANLPYGCATPLMTNLLLDYPNCAGLYVTVQKEVADRLGAKPGTKEYGPLSIIATATASVKSIAKLPPECFWPRPEVTSAMCSAVRLGEALTPQTHALADFVQLLFEQRRKQIGGVLRDRFDVREPFAYPEGIDAKTRAENLSAAQLLELLLAVESGGGRTGAVS
ncbi:MAG: 16S rRNA (adenine(1518)-N(6)/adenine(1519)-N(6))-dimethyltransferase RsmA [Phycisphaerales bacterium]|nr:16S rRNA (adenine(1518)-N(6)/adenine(1519)-N(6))-dimethyltransferase RsmA [Phycisphaerales bacterium]